MEVFPRNLPIGRALKALEKLDIEEDESIYATKAAVFSILRHADKKILIGDVEKVTSRLEKINDGISSRLAARQAKKWAEADRIRDELTAMGIALKDAKNPETGEIVTTWEIAR
jgi:cysteinyl-tRNA synthetase